MFFFPPSLLHNAALKVFHYMNRYKLLQVFLYRAMTDNNLNMENKKNVPPDQLPATACQVPPTECSVLSINLTSGEEEPVYWNIT